MARKTKERYLRCAYKTYYTNTPSVFTACIGCTIVRPYIFAAGGGMIGENDRVFHIHLGIMCNETE